jgi:hypothetical protein
MFKVLEKKDAKLLEVCETSLGSGNVFKFENFREYKEIFLRVPEMSLSWRIRLDCSHLEYFQNQRNFYVSYLKVYLTCIRNNMANEKSLEQNLDFIATLEDNISQWSKMTVYEQEKQRLLQIYPK